MIAAAILRHLHAVITTGRAWDPTIATHGTRPRSDHRARRLTQSVAADQADGRGEPYAALRTNEYLDAHHGQPRPSSHQPDYTLLGTIPITAMQGQTTDEAPAKALTQNDLR